MQDFVDKDVVMLTLQIQHVDVFEQVELGGGFALNLFLGVTFFAEDVTVVNHGRPLKGPVVVLQSCME